MSPEWIGWCATALFALSYFVEEPATMRRVQAGAASVWIAYGVLIKAPPVVAANVVVAALALLSSRRRDTGRTSAAAARARTRRPGRRGR